MTGGDFDKEDNPEKKLYFERVGNRIKFLRKKQAYSSAEAFSFAHNISRSQYALYEKGKNLTLWSLNRVIKAMDLDMSDFFEKGWDELPEDKQD